MQAQAAEYSGYAGPFRCFLQRSAGARGSEQAAEGGGEVRRSEQASNDRGAKGP
jgi:hypothetical protein